MVFNSLTFLWFFAIVFFIYWFPLKNTTKGQNIFLLLASYFFYGYADWRMLPLLIIATLIFFYLGKAISVAKTEKQAYWLTFVGVALGIGTLLYFKYFNFFLQSFASIFNAFGLQTNIHSFNIIMPLGISFFTFRLLSYIIDIYRGKSNPTDDIVAFGAYVAFFPCLLSGPIDRPVFIKQLQTKRVFNYEQSIDGCRQILWGLFKKVLVADNCAIYVDQVWDNIGANTSSTLILAAVLYLFQIYADFSGYSDMAIGVGKLLGFKIADNFKFPLFALNIADYWRRWHITLTQWLTDYVFMPLNINFRDWGKWGMIVSIIITFVLIGMWHGANWTFALFGLYHGLLYIPLILSGAFFKKAKLKTNQFGLPVAKDFGRMLLTLTLVVVGLILFRADDINQAWEYTCGICDKSILSVPWLINRMYYFSQFIIIAIMLVFEWINRKKNHGLDISDLHPVIRIVIFILVFQLIQFFLPATPSNFIYFQF